MRKSCCQRTCASASWPLTGNPISQIGSSRQADSKNRMA